jgi:hypothetical protein
MAVTPNYKRLKTNGTSFYAFPGAAEDISAAYQNQNYRMYFSKYILLNFPKQNTNSGTNSNDIYFDFDNSFQRSVFSQPTIDYKDQLIESLRNYVANQEVAIKESKLNNTEYYYDNRVLSTPTEKIFWKWCKKLNLIDFEPANNGDEYFGNLSEFQSLNTNDVQFFPEILWKEREIVEWETVVFYESGEPGYSNKLEIEFEGTTNFRVGDIIEFDNISSSTLTSNGIYSGKRTTVEKIIAPTTVLGQRIVSSINYSAGTASDTGSSVKISYNRLVQYIGEVNGINNVSEANRSYTEVYAHVPDHTGQTPDILFRTSVDENYKPNLIFPILPSQYQPEIIGAALNGSINFSSPIVANPTNYPGNYYGQFDTEDFTYETGTGDVVRRSGDYFGISGDTDNPVVNGPTIDGITVDFNTTHYVKMNILGREVGNFDSFNALEVNNEPPLDFEFNAILWYYTVEDLNGNATTNLYGISFVDNPDNNPVESEVGIRVPTFKKLAANNIQDGTSYAFSLNLSFNIVNENPQDTFNPEAINSLFSMNLFNTAMRRLSSVNESYLNIIAEQNSLQEDVVNIKQLLYSQTDFAVINQRIANLETLLRLYSTMQFQTSETIEVVVDTVESPPRLTMNNIDTVYNNIFRINTSSLYNVNGAIPYIINVPLNKNILIHIINDDVNNLTLPNNEKLTILLDKDLYFKQSVDIIIESNDLATQNKKLEIFMSYQFLSSTNPAVETQIIETIDLPVFFNSTTQLTNSAKNWKENKFQIDLNKTLQLTTGGILEVPILANPTLVNNSFKVGDTFYLENFSIGTSSQIDFSGQYTIDNIGVVNSYIYLNVNNNTELINYGSSSSNITSGGLPLPFNSTASTYLLANYPYFRLNKGVKYRITRVDNSISSGIDERYLVEKQYL